MHFRVRLNSVQLVRTTYDAEKKRGRYEVIGSVPQRALVLPEALAARLTPEDMVDVSAYVASRFPPVRQAAPLVSQR